MLPATLIRYQQFFERVPDFMELYIKLTRQNGHR